MVTFAVEEEKLICFFSGQMNTENCYKFQEDISGKVKEAKRCVIFDIQKVDYVASAFLSMCIQISKETGAENFTLRNASPNVKKVFKIAGLDTRITII